MEIARRRFLELHAAAMVAAAFPGCAAPIQLSENPRTVNPYYEEAPIDLHDVLSEHVVESKRRTAPALTWPYSPTWIGHYGRPEYRMRGSLPGIDYAPVSVGGTKVTPVAAGVVTQHRYNLIGGWMVEIFHGGFIHTIYMHLREQGYRSQGSLVDRQTVIGTMGNTGSGALSEHLHLSAFISFKIGTLLKIQHLHEHGGVYSPAPLNFDPEEFSVLGRHHSLPYSIPDDRRLDSRNAHALRMARTLANEILREFFPGYWRAIKDHSFENVYGDKDLGDDLAVIYLHAKTAVSGIKHRLVEEPRIPARDASTVVMELEKVIKASVPRFTAPVG